MQFISIKCFPQNCDTFVTVISAAAATEPHPVFLDSRLGDALLKMWTEGLEINLKFV